MVVRYRWEESEEWWGVDERRVRMWWDVVRGGEAVGGIGGG